MHELRDVITGERNTISHKGLSTYDLLSIIIGEKIWKEFQFEPLPKDIVIKKEPKDKSDSKTRDAFFVFTGQT